MNECLVGARGDGAFAPARSGGRSGKGPAGPRRRHLRAHATLILELLVFPQYASTPWVAGTVVVQVKTSCCEEQCFFSRASSSSTPQPQVPKACPTTRPRYVKNQPEFDSNVSNGLPSDWQTGPPCWGPGS